jgi:K+-sensing histidine kinase KdpD
LHQPVLPFHPPRQFPIFSAVFLATVISITVLTGRDAGLAALALSIVELDYWLLPPYSN